MDQDFLNDGLGLAHAIDLLGRDFRGGGPLDLPPRMPEAGLGPYAVLDVLAPHVLGKSARLGAPQSFAHMDPPTPWITWAAALWNASLNQNLLHPATAPVARSIEEQVIAWLGPFFGMTGGHVVPGSTLANLTALWAARECAGVRQVVASDSAHVSIAKAAHILGLEYLALPADAFGALVPDSIRGDLNRAALVLTAGTTSTGAIDALNLAGRAAWTHVDAAWAGPLRLSSHAGLLSGIERADSVSVSAHKWLFQPKESAMILFRNAERANAAISFGASYLSVPNVGVLGSHGATAVPLLATLLAWGRAGIAARIEHCMSLADRLAEFLAGDSRLRLLAPPRTGILVWRPRDGAAFDRVFQQLPPGAVSMTTIGGERWYRMVAANPNANIDLLIDGIKRAAQ